MTKQTEFISTNIQTLVNKDSLDLIRAADTNLCQFLTPWYNEEKPEVENAAQKPETSL